MSYCWVIVSIIVEGFGLWLALLVLPFTCKTVDEPEFMEKDQVKSNRADQCGQILDIKI